MISSIVIYSKLCCLSITRTSYAEAPTRSVPFAIRTTNACEYDEDRTSCTVSRNNLLKVPSTQSDPIFEFTI
jgi:hypothetical protein